MKPTRKTGLSHLEDYREDHPAYAVISAARVNGNVTLAGSDFRHRHFISIVVERAHLSRGLSHDRWYGGPEVIRLSMSEAQWATFVSSLNVGPGVPCTLERTEKDGCMPPIDVTPDRVKQFTSDVNAVMKDALAKMHEAYDEAPTRRLKAMIAVAMQEITANAPFVQKQFREHVEQTVEKAKIEVNAYMTNAVQRAGMDALKNTPIQPLEGPNPLP